MKKLFNECKIKIDNNIGYDKIFKKRKKQFIFV